MNKAISILFTTPMEGVFQLDCAACKQSMIVSITMNNDRPHKSIADRITKQDIEDIHTFLEKFDGDFKTLFK